MNFKIALTKGEKQIIRQVAKIQIDSLNRLLHNDSTEDVQLVCAVEGVSYHQFRKALEEQLDTFNQLHLNPNHLINLPQSEKSKVKHILNVFIPQTHERSMIWRKFLLTEDFYYSPN